MTPIPAGLARPLVESLHCDAVADNHDIDTVIPPPAKGLTPYLNAVQLALDRASSGEIQSAWPTRDSGVASPADPLPSDPDWAGQRVSTDSVSTHADADVNAVWADVSTLTNRRWRLHFSDPQDHSVLLKYSGRLPGTAWLAVNVAENGGTGSTVEHRATLRGVGLAGQLYAATLWPLHRKLLHRKVSGQIANAARRVSLARVED